MSMLRKLLGALRSNPGKAVKRAMSLCESGQYEDADSLCRAVLQAQPDHGGALHCRGVIALRQDRIAQAVPLLEIAAKAQGADIQVQYDLAEAYRLNAQWEAACTAYRRVVEATPDVMAAHMGLADSLLVLRNAAEARWHCQRVLESEPHNLRALMLAGELSLHGQGPDEAESAIRAALARTPGNRDLEHALAKMLIGQNRLPEASHVLQSALLSCGDDAQHTLVRLVEAAVRCGVSLDTLEEHAQMPSIIHAQQSQPLISIIICSVDAQKYAAVTAHYAELMAGERYEIIGIHDARSLCEGYNRGAKRATGELLVFSHDDIEIMTPDFAPRLRRHLSQHDVVGPCGTSRLVIGHWLGAGWPFVHGLVAHHFPPGHEQAGLYRVLVLDASAQDVSGRMQALDGMFMAARREVVERCRFDEEAFDGFHLYDLDFSFSAYLAGYDVAVFRDITMIHYTYGQSEGYEEAFTHYRLRFQEKYRDRLMPGRSGGKLYIPAVFETKDQVRWFCANLLALRRTAAGVPVN